MANVRHPGSYSTKWLTVNIQVTPSNCNLLFNYFWRTTTFMCILHNFDLGVRVPEPEPKPWPAYQHACHSVILCSWVLLGQRGPNVYLILPPSAYGQELPGVPWYACLKIQVKSKGQLSSESSESKGWSFCKGTWTWWWGDKTGLGCLQGIQVAWSEHLFRCSSAPPGWCDKSSLFCLPWVLELICGYCILQVSLPSLSERVDVWGLYLARSQVTEKGG